MLFIFDEETTDYFTMKNCGIDLDIVFIGADKKVTSVAEQMPHSYTYTPDVKAYDSKPVTCEEPYQFVLEVNINSGIEVEDELEQEDDDLSEEEKQFAG